MYTFCSYVSNLLKKNHFFCGFQWGFLGGGVTYRGGFFVHYRGWGGEWEVWGDKMGNT